MSTFMLSLIRQYKESLPLKLFPIYWSFRTRDYLFWKLTSVARSKLPTNTEPKIVFIIGMPRTGSTLAKRYLGSHKDIKIAEYESYRESFSLAQSLEFPKILLDKATYNIDQIHNIDTLAKNKARYLGIVRDPRAELVSLLEKPDFHAEIPRNKIFWASWEFRYSRLLSSLKIISKTTSDARIIRYEDLATNPIGIKEAFCKWINISGRDDISNQYEPLPGTPSEDWKVHSTNKVHPKSIDRWRDYSGKDSWLLDFYKEYMPAKKLMKDFGYINAPRQKSVRGVNFL